MTHTLHDLFAARVRDVPPPLYGPAPTRGGKLISFSYGLADPDLFPREDLLAATAAVLDQDAAEALNYGPSFPGRARSWGCCRKSSSTRATPC
jgi:2-aminoadipate transaminase